MPPIFSSKRIAPDRAVDAEVRADADLAQAPGAVVGGQRVAAGRPRRARADAPTTSPSRSSSSTPRRRYPPGRRAHRSGCARWRSTPCGPGEDLAAGHVAPAVGVDPGAPLDAERQVGALRLDAQLARAAQAVDEHRLEGAQLAPRSAPGRAGRGTARRRRTPGSRRAPCRPAGRAPPSATASSTSASSASARAAAGGHARRGPAARGRRRPAPGCSPAPGCARLAWALRASA